MLFETDVLLAAMNSKDPVHTLALKVFGSGTAFLSPFSLLEINLLSRAGKLEILDYKDYANNLGALLNSYSVEVRSDKTLYHSVAREFEFRHKLTFFDSLHDAVSKVEGDVLASIERVYDRLDNEGVKRINPREL